MGAATELNNRPKRVKALFTHSNGCCPRHLEASMKKHALAAIIAATTITAPASRAQTPMQQMTPGTDYLQTLNDERNNPDHPIWRYIAGVVSGANVAAIMTSGKPIACVMHPLEDSETTANMILRYLIETDMVGKEAATLEIAAVAAFSWYYPCGQML